MNDKRQIKTFVWHEEECFFVSTIERDSSATVVPSLRYFETIAWEYDWDSEKRGKLIHMDGEAPAFEQHFAICESLYRHGKVVDHA